MFQLLKGTRTTEKTESTQFGGDSKNNIEPVKKSFFKDKTFLVTGGTGFLGSHLIPLVRNKKSFFLK
jgi:FlaA1/EpsC-like NDP-sugar epimerase